MNSSGKNKFTPYAFQWQEGFGAFSYSQSSLNNVINYIRNQKQHHQKHSLREEYIGLLEKFEVDYKEQYLFEWIDDN